MDSREYPVLGVQEVHDGDTFRLMVDVGFEHAAFPWLRLKGYSCPEVSTAKGREALAATRDLLPRVGRVVTHKRAGYEDMEKSFARYLAEVYLDDGSPLGEQLVKLGLADRGAHVG